MAIVNHAKREINAKIVYYGAENTGKGTSLRYAYDRIKPSLRSELKAVPASGSSLLFFSFNPFEQPVFGDYRICLHIYTLQGKVANPAAWKMTLKGADGLVIVTDASPEKLSEAQQSLVQVREFLNCYGVGLSDIPVVLQLNKADLADGAVPADTARALGLYGCTTGLTTALSGDGVLEVLTSLSRQIMERIGTRDDVLRESSRSVAADVGNVHDFETIRPASASVDVPIGTEAAGTVVESVPDKVSPVAALPTVAGIQVAVDTEGICVEGGNVLIPLEIACPGGTRRLLVTVSVAPA